MVCATASVGRGLVPQDWRGEGRLGEGDLKKVSNSMLKVKIRLETLNERPDIKDQD